MGESEGKEAINDKTRRLQDVRMNIWDLISSSEPF